MGVTTNLQWLHAQLNAPGSNFLAFLVDATELPEDPDTILATTLVAQLRLAPGNDSHSVPQEKATALLERLRSRGWRGGESGAQSRKFSVRRHLNRPGLETNRVLSHSIWGKSKEDHCPDAYSHLGGILSPTEGRLGKCSVPLRREDRSPCPTTWN